MKITIKKFKEAIKGSVGIHASIARKLGVERSSVTRFLEKNPDLLSLIEEEREKMVDLAENKLFTKINEGEWLPIKFYLSTKGKNRGYVEKTELEHSGELNENTKLIVEIIDNAKDVKDADQPLNEDSPS